MVEDGVYAVCVLKWWYPLPTCNSGVMITSQLATKAHLGGNGMGIVVVAAPQQPDYRQWTPWMAELTSPTRSNFLTGVVDAVHGFSRPIYPYLPLFFYFLFFSRKMTHWYEWYTISLGPKVWLGYHPSAAIGPGSHAREPSHHPELLVRLLQRGAFHFVLYLMDWTKKHGLTMECSIVFFFLV